MQGNKIYSAMLTIKFTPNAVLLISVAAMLVPVIWIETAVLLHTHGTIAYPLDDTFIHMSVAKTLAFDHVWGISKYSFESASSSPLYTILLAVVFLVTGAHLVTPLLINILAAIVFLAVLQRWLIRQGLTAMNRLLIMLAVIFLSPLPLLVISGMEHTLQLLFCFLFIYSFSASAHGKLPWQVYLYGILMVTTRYETMSMVAIACLFLLFRRQWWSAVKLGSISLLPVILFGLYAMSKGSYFMPNSVLLKSGMPPLTFEGLTAFFFNVFWDKLLFASQDYNILTAQRLLLILPLVYLISFDAIRRHPAYGYTLIILLGAVLGHVSFAYYSPYPRYEAYLVGCSLPVIGVLVLRHGLNILPIKIKGSEWIAWSLLVMLAIPLLFRAATTFGNAAQCCINIYDQQYQMAQFVHSYYNKEPVAFNDIGAVSYYSEGKKLDLMGIASLDVLKAKRMRLWNSNFADSLSRRDNIRLAIVYDKWFSPFLLQRWKKIATWEIRNNVIAGDDIVSFYSVNKVDSATLRRHLQEYQPSLPGGVVVRYY